MYPDVDWEAMFLVYDNVCNLAKYAENPTRAQIYPGVTDVVAKMRKVLDRLHQVI